MGEICSWPLGCVVYDAVTGADLAHASALALLAPWRVLQAAWQVFAEVLL